MPDNSDLDRKYFIDNEVYNCPFCNRNNVSYMLLLKFKFDWTDNKICYGYIVICKSCHKRSMHLSYDVIHGDLNLFKDNINLDEHIFYSVPTSFFIIDNRIPKIIRELISECEGCKKMNYLTGASACMRKAVYELIVHEQAVGTDYEERIKSLKSKYKDIDPQLFDILVQIKDLTSEKIHEQSWDKWDSQNISLIIEVLKTVLHNIYVIPNIKNKRSKFISELRAKINKSKKGSG